MPFDIKALMRNKPALIGLAVAGGAGLYVLVKRKQTTGSTASDAAAASGDGMTASLPGYPNTVGTDVAAWLGSQESVLATQNQQFLDQLKETLGNTSNPTPAPQPAPAPTPTRPGHATIGTIWGGSTGRTMRPLSPWG